jgi:hypothetical protein
MPDESGSSRVGINAHERFGPEPITRMDLFDLLADVRRPYQRERTGKPLVIAHQRMIEIKDVHADPHPRRVIDVTQSAAGDNLTP